MKKYVFILSLFAFSSCRNKVEQGWQLTPFVKADAENPILLPNDTTTFDDPIMKKTINWEAKDVYNPSAVVRDGKVYLLVSCRRYFEGCRWHFSFGAGR